MNKMKRTEATSNGYGAFFAHTKGVSVSGLVKLDVENAVHDINNADQLAEALQNLLDVVGKQTHALSPEDFLAVDAGLLAIQNYQGGE